MSAPKAVSSGPRTAEGQAISSQNATSHGLSSPRAVLAHESQPEFNRLSTDVQNEFQPETPHEEFLVSQMVAARWKLQRAGNIETAIFEEMMLGDETNSPRTPEARMAKAMLDRGGDALNRIQRYIAALERSYYKAHRELLQGRKLQNEIQRKAATAEFKAQEAELLAYLNAPVPPCRGVPAHASTPLRSATPHATSGPSPTLGGSAGFPQTMACETSRGD